MASGSRALFQQSTCAFQIQFVKTSELYEISIKIADIPRKGSQIMPQIIDTPEDWFRTQQRDLYVVNYRHPEGNNECPDEVDSSGLMPERQQISEKFEAKRKAWRMKVWRRKVRERKAWFAQHLPKTPLDIIGPSEYSGWIEGGPRYFTADLDQEGLAAFEAAWGPESAWQVEVWSYSDWRKRVDAAELLPTPLSKPQRLRWWDTPRGVLLLGADTEGHLLSLYDGWWKLQQLFPEFAECKYTKYACGEFRPRDQEYRKESHEIVVALGFDYIFDLHKYASDQQNIQRLKDALGISENTPLEIVEGDY